MKIFPHATHIMFVVLLLVGCQKEQLGFRSVTCRSVDCLDTTDTASSPRIETVIDMEFAVSDTHSSENVSDVINACVIEKAFDMQLKDPDMAADAYIHQQVERYRAEMLDLYRQHKDKETSELFLALDETHQIIGRVSRGREGFIGYVIQETDMTGAAHPYHCTTYLNFDEKTGNAVELGDIFLESKMTQLSDILLDKLMEKCGVQTLQQLNDAGYLTQTDMTPSRLFLLEKDSVSFFYNEYDIAPYSTGPTEIKVSCEELKGVMK